MKENRNQHNGHEVEHNKRILIMLNEAIKVTWSIRNGLFKDCRELQMSKKTRISIGSRIEKEIALH